MLAAANVISTSSLYPSWVMGLLSFLYGTISHVSFEGQGHSILNRPSLNIRHLDQRYKVVKFLNTS